MSIRRANSGVKLWTMFVEPPCEYTVTGDQVEVDIMGTKQSFALREGPPPHR